LAGLYRASALDHGWAKQVEGHAPGIGHTQIVKLGLEYWILQGRYLRRAGARGALYE